MGRALLGSASRFGHAGPARPEPGLRCAPATLLVVVGLHIEARDTADLALKRPAQQGHGLLLFLLRGRRWWWGRGPGGRLRGHWGLRRRALCTLRAPCRFDQRPLVQGAALGLLLFLLLLGAIGERVLTLWGRRRTLKGGKDPRGPEARGRRASPSGSAPASC